MELEDRVKEELVKLEGDVEKNKRRIVGLHRAIDADERTIRALKEILGPSVEAPKKEKGLHKRASLRTIILEYARSHLNEEVSSDNITEHIAQARGYPPSKGTLSTYLGKLVKGGLLRRMGRERFAYAIPKEALEETPEEEEKLFGNKIDSKGAVLEVLRSRSDEVMKTMQIAEAIKQKYPTLHVSRDMIWFHLNKTLGPMGLVKKVSLGSYQYEFPKKELREDDCFAVGGD